MRAVVAAVALAQDSRMLFSTGARIPAVSSQAQVAAIYDEMPLEIAQPVMYAQPEPIVYAQPEGPAAGDLSWVLPGVAVLAVSAVAGAYVSRARADAELEAEEEEEDADLEAAWDAAEAVALAGPLYLENTLENKVAMLFSSGKSVKGKAAAAKKPAAKKPAPKKAAPKPAARKVAPKKPAPKKPVAKKPVRGALKGPSLQAASSTIPFLQELFSLSAVGGGQGNTLR